MRYNDKIKIERTPEQMKDAIENLERHARRLGLHHPMVATYLTHAEELEAKLTVSVREEDRHAGNPY